MAQRIFKLRSLNSVAIDPGRLQKVKLNDLEIIKDWYISFNQESLSKKIDEDKARNHVRKAIESGKYYGWENERNKYCCLFTDLANPTSNSIYMKIGYQPIADYLVYNFKE